ncbi:hypothetical protein AL035_04240 [Salipiger aestuarii]|uniref:Uncharacterized protein DUF3306 n=1 Tax=Salipiger aestuarii TaxID=568098 RepID=A0A327YFM3_9RHOB|nr:DUF3306 domain-containing protein [Salipiger aestuarii]KAB2543067.1 hypothetical protein AL035_04240 [Salipiger aestuarii]RAK19664.1 uncharacterized protein DUF3306 [Salipiger aestuarii]
MSGFWARRREAVAAETRAESAAREDAARSRTEAELEARSDEDLLAELNLPEPETLVGGEDLRRFLAAQLPQRLKRRALRALWRSNPVLACLDGLNDYEDDFTDAAVAQGAVTTLYQVGRGFAERVQEVAEKLPGPDAASDPVAMVEAAPAPLPDPPARIAAAPEPAPGTDAETEQDAPLPPRLRRMQFQFDPEGPA